MFLGVPIDWSTLSRQDQNSEKKLLDSSVLPELLTQWMRRQSASERNMHLYTGDVSMGSRKESTVKRLLARAALECDTLDHLLEPSRSTALAIRILIETLISATHNLAHLGTTEICTNQKIEQNPLLEERFLSSGWCPYQIARLWGQYSPSTTYYLSSLPREPTFGGVTHDQCNAGRCMTTTIDPATYEPRHIESCSGSDSVCHMVGVQSSKVAECIKRGRIPLVRFEESVDGTLRPEITESPHGLQYVALSHVWSGGLGNVKSNSMYSCQLRKLHDLLLRLRNDADDDLDRRLGTRKFHDARRDLRQSIGMPLPEPPILLWIDTLCVPVGGEHREMRQSAIAQMAQIYVEAQCVLVVDPELEKMSHKALADEQIFASVLCSSWNSRSWTFQEACMARVFYIQFSDGHCVVDEKWHKFMKTIEETTHSGEHAIDMQESLMLEVSDWFRTMPVMTKLRDYDTRTLMSMSEDWKNFVRVWNGLRTRSTTKTDDLHGIIAIMMDLSAYEILKLDPRERMKAILRAQSTLPLPLLYQDCPKICDFEGRPLWAPLEIRGGRLEMDRGYMSVQQDGLLINTSQPDTARHTWPSAYRFSTEGPVPTLFTLRLAHQGLTVPLELCQATPVSITEPARSWIVLWKEDLSVGRTGYSVPGVLLALRTLEGSTLVTHYVCPLRVSAQRLNDEIHDSKGNMQPSASLLEAKPVSLDTNRIKIQTDITSWYDPKLRISKRLLSSLVIIRNCSMLWEFGAIAVTSNLYLFALIGCAVHHRQPLVLKILYLMIARYLTIFLELYWVAMVLVKWDSERTSRWSTRLYGSVNVSMWHRVGKELLHPCCITKIIPLLVGSISMGLYHTHRWTWAKWYGIIEFTEVGFRLAFTCTVTSAWYYAISHGHIEMTRADWSDMPEDMTNYSRIWRARNAKDDKRRAERKARLRRLITPQRFRRSDQTLSKTEEDA
ncbi:MAG: hypothetical protein Q9224_003910 [Gallowayella concinna]